MFLDASAIVAILAHEADADELTARVASANQVLTPPIAMFEAVLALGRIHSAPIDVMEQLVADFLAETGSEIVAGGRLPKSNPPDRITALSRRPKSYASTFTPFQNATRPLICAASGFGSA